MGGVVNIITREPDPGIRYTAIADLGSWGVKSLGGDYHDLTTGLDGKGHLNHYRRPHILSLDKYSP